MSKLLCPGLCLVSSVFPQKWEDLALTPPLGWNSWNSFHQHVNETVARETAEAMGANGMRGAGYDYIVINDTRSLGERDDHGHLEANPEKFPLGMRTLGDGLHARGFTFAMCAGPSR